MNTKTTTIAREALVERYQIPPLPPHPDLETRKILKALTIAHKNLAELKGRASSIPNQGILIDTLMLQEAAASSEIENIVTTQDELFQLLKTQPEGIGYLWVPAGNKLNLPEGVKAIKIK